MKSSLLGGWIFYRGFIVLAESRLPECLPGRRKHALPARAEAEAVLTITNRECNSKDTVKEG